MKCEHDLVFMTLSTSQQRVRTHLYFTHALKAFSTFNIFKMHPGRDFYMTFGSYVTVLYFDTLVQNIFFYPTDSIAVLRKPRKGLKV